MALKLKLGPLKCSVVKIEDILTTEVQSFLLRAYSKRIVTPVTLPQIDHLKTKTQVLIGFLLSGASKLMLAGIFMMSYVYGSH